MISKGREITAQMSAVFECRNDFNLTFLSDVSELTGVTGFSPKEMQEIHRNSLKSLVRSDYRDRMLQELMEQLHDGDEIEVVFPIVCCDGTVKWVLCRGCKINDVDGTECLNGVLVDITRSKRKYDYQKKTLELYQIILSQTENVIFLWDCIEDTISFSGAWETVFGYTPRTKKISRILTDGETFHPEDKKMLGEQLDIMRGGTAYRFLEIRIRRADGRYLWCRLRATGIYDDTTGKLLKIAGVIIDIDDEKKAAKALQEQAERDALTGLLNANTARKRAEEYLETRKKDVSCALLVIDLDNFKQINDRFGHMCGDVVLTQVAETIRKRFRSQDIIGRMGGEEFMVLMKDVSDVALVEHRCALLVDAMHDVCKGQLRDVVVSCSIGAVMTRSDAETYPTLFALADQAMYQAKEQGRDQYVLKEVGE